MIVIDASVTLAWMHAEEWTQEIEAVIDRVIAEGAITSPVRPLEVTNALQMAVRRRRVAVSDRDALLQNVRALPVMVEAPEPARIWRDVLALSDRHQLTTHDASYLEIAIRRRLPLATLDGELIAAAAAEGLDVLPSAA